MLDFTIRTHAGDLKLEVALQVQGPLLLLGGNGAGKSTLLEALLGGRPTHGRITLAGRTLLDSGAGVDLPPEARHLGYVPQGEALFPHLNAWRNVAFGLQGTEAQRRQRALAVLDDLQAAHLADRRPAGLSGGEAQRVALARALAIAPDALLLDEPMASLDGPSRTAAWRLLAKILEERPVPSICVTHEVTDALATGWPIAVLEAGRVVQSGPLAELRAHPATPAVRHLLGT